MTESLTKRLGKLGVVPVVVIDDAERAPALGRALLEGGLPCAEVTFRTEAGEEALRRLSGQFEDLLIGAGTVLTVSQAERAARAGAQFIVSPGLNLRVVDYCLEHELPVYPGVCTPTEIESALERELTILKFFPAEAMGGVQFLKAVSAPYPMVSFIPTGGISPSNLEGYLAHQWVLACGGSWMVNSKWISAGNFDQIQQQVREAVALVSRARGAAS